MQKTLFDLCRNNTIVLSYGIPWNQSVTVPTFNVKDSIELMYLFGVCFFSF